MCIVALHKHDLECITLWSFGLAGDLLDIERMEEVDVPIKNPNSLNLKKNLSCKLSKWLCEAQDNKCAYHCRCSQFSKIKIIE